MSTETVGDRASQRIISVIAYGYFRLYHRLKINLHPDFPMTGPSLALMAHFSNLDSALVPADPRRPRTIPVVKKELMEIPGIGWGLSQWEAIPADRGRQDSQAARSILRVFEEKRGVCIAPEGTRNKTGRLGPMNKTVVAIALKASEKGIPIFPIAAVGAYEALPHGSWFPKPRKITVISGPLIDLSNYHGQRLKGDELMLPARLIRDSMAALLPERNQPLKDSPAL